ncbi:MAG: ATP-dependent DNA helicase RecG [Minisyncoccota bacterium]
MDLNTELIKIDGIGPKFIPKLSKLNIKTVKDLLWHFPFRYDDFSKVIPIADLKSNQPATIQGIVKKIGLRRTFRQKLVLVEAIIVDDTGGVRAMWFNQAYLLKILKPGTRANFAGKIIESKKDLYLSNPVYEITSSYGISSATGGPRHTAGLIPVYPETKGVSSKFLRYVLKPILTSIPQIEDFLPKEILVKNVLPDINSALKKIHFPLRAIDAEAAKKRFAFENLFLLQLNNLKIKSQLAQEKSEAILVDQEFLSRLLAELPFVLTGSQKEVLHEVLSDIQRARPMNRLLQGDVGSGKTVIAAIAAILAAKNGQQTAILAPTEVLAQQHYRTITKLFKGFEKDIEILTGGSKAKKSLNEKIVNGEKKIIIGTHAIIQKTVKFKNLALVIVDEQHRFGVEQRAALLRSEKKSLAGQAKVSIPHLLSMSATPIPRTLALTIFGDLDLSIINELPAGRKPIITKVVSPSKRADAYGYIKEQILKGRQAFVICPRIEPGTKDEEERKILSESQQKLLDLKSVKEEYERLSKKIFPDLKIAMLHGKLKNTEKENIMKDFQDKKYDILVSTSVIEVGVDVPNATIMMIEGADRFGLAQLYQFRGRVGRSEHQSFCLLFTDSESASTQYRLDSLLTAKNGFELAEKDLELRGPGQFMGKEQTGLPDIAMDALKNIELVKAAKSSAEEMLSNDPDFKQHPLLIKRLEDFTKNIHQE